MSLVGLEGGGGNVTRLGRFANYLRSILPHADVTLTEMTAKAIGQLALAEGTYTAEYVEFEVKRALEWILGSENKKLAAVSQELSIIGSNKPYILECWYSMWVWLVYFTLITGSPSHSSILVIFSLATYHFSVLESDRTENCCM